MNAPRWFTVIAASVAVVLPPLAIAEADPPPPPVPTQPANPAVQGPQCNGQTVPLDPRVSVRDPIGTLIYLRMLEAMCGPEAPR